MASTARGCVGSSPTSSGRELADTGAGTRCELIAVGGIDHGHLAVARHALVGVEHDDRRVELGRADVAHRVVPAPERLELAERAYAGDLHRPEHTPGREAQRLEPPQLRFDVVEPPVEGREQPPAEVLGQLQVALAVGEPGAPVEGSIELGRLRGDLGAEPEQALEERSVVLHEVAAEELRDRLVLDPGQRRWLDRPALERLGPRRGERVERPLPRLAGSFHGGHVAQLLEPLRLGVQPGCRDGVVDLGGAAVHLDQILRRRTALPDQRERDVRDVVEVARHCLTNSY